MNLAPTLAILAFFCLIWLVLLQLCRDLSPIVSAVLLILAMLFAAAAIFLHTNPHILQ